MKIKYDREGLDQLKTRLKERYPQLTYTDLNFIDGHESRMLTLIAYKLRKTKDEMDEIIKRL
ncbi:MAG: general stress protein CsbD [Bacteroidales bacterium]|nr:general stress protein CsbD [Bacteroidales bacterium]